MFFALLIEQFRYQFLTKLPSIGSLTSVAPPAPAVTYHAAELVPSSTRRTPGPGLPASLLRIIGTASVTFQGNCSATRRFKMTKRYAHLSPGYMQNVAGKLDTWPSRVSCQNRGRRLVTPMLRRCFQEVGFRKSS